MPLTASVTREDCGHDDCFPSCGSEEVEVAGDVTWIRWRSEYAVEVRCDEKRLTRGELIAAQEALISRFQAGGRNE